MPKEGKVLYGWEYFTEWAMENGVNLEAEEDYDYWWECWKAAFNTGYSQAVQDLEG